MLRRTLRAGLSALGLLASVCGHEVQAAPGATLGATGAGAAAAGSTAPSAAVPGTAPAARGPTIGSGWCVIVASEPYDAFDAAIAEALHARAAGAASAGVYDPRDFTNLAWGALAVIAVGGLPSAADAQRAAAPLKKAKLGADVKQCLVASGVATALARAADIAPLAKAPSGPALHVAASRVLGLDAGCFAWSATRKAAACITGMASSQAGELWQVVFPGTELTPVELAKRDGAGMTTSLPELVLPAATAAELEERLAEGKFTRLALPGRELRPNSHVDWVSPRLSVKWDRKSSGVVDHGGGSWASFDDHLQIRCGALSRPYQELLATTGQNTVDATGKVTVIPGTTHVLVERTAPYGIEGEHGTEVDAMLIDLTDCHILP